MKSKSKKTLEEKLEIIRQGFIRRQAKRTTHTKKKLNKITRRAIRPLSYKINTPEQAEKMAKALDDFLRRK